MMAGFVKQVELQSEIRSTLFVPQIGSLGVTGHTAADFQACLARRQPVAHELDRGKTAQVLQIGFSAAGTPTGTDFIITVQARADDRRIAHAARDLECQPTGGGRARDISLGVDSGAVNRSRRAAKLLPQLTGHPHQHAVPVEERGRIAVRALPGRSEPIVFI